MASLQDQLLQAGLVDKKKAKQIGKEKRKQQKVAKKSSQPQVDETKLAAQQARADKAARDRALNAERDAAAQQKAIAAQIKQLVNNNRQPYSGETAYNFTFDKKIKTIYVSEILRDHLIAGRLVIVAQGEQFELVPRVIADKIAERNTEIIVKPTETSTSVDEDDPYADFQIPDDLMW
ncbi:DUF2058 domain-containing protein [Microbulbifer variabilis]|jgi:uncharacterized protein YaiL (DUF2058 family)|uniref:DUF2058 domain-containing protein n=1 Tax=Microbulbifer variabilis TaxID=266805 RepID=A0ABY4V8M0_9GAMM|nr:DUF2058 domain-containing protein [Microbulbifer variabilis]USD20270.1 DUF2058 domain-containing protein [Microbulbifer variabilis]